MTTIRFEYRSARAPQNGANGNATPIITAKRIPGQVLTSASERPSSRR